MLWGPALIAHLPWGPLQPPLHSEQFMGSALPGLLGPHREWERAGGSEKPLFALFRLIGVNCLGRLKNSTAKGKCGC